MTITYEAQMTILSSPSTNVLLRRPWNEVDDLDIISHVG